MGDFIEPGGPGEVGGLQIPHRSVGYALSGDPQFGPDRYIVQSYGNTRNSAPAVAEFHHQNRDFRYLNLSNDVLDAILDMPVGFRTKGSSDLLRGVPLGLLLWKLTHRAFERFHSANVIGSLVFVGTFIRFKNRVDTLAAIPSNEDPNVPYYPKSISKDVDAFYFTQLPLDRVELRWPFAESTLTAITPTTFLGIANVSLLDYMRDFTVPTEGSDMTFFVVSSGAYIMKRYNNFGHPPGYAGEFRRFKTKMIRTAGLRQILIRSFKHDITISNSSIDRSFTVYIPGGSEGNCFESALRWCYCQNTLFVGTEGEYAFRRVWGKVVSDRALNTRVTFTEYVDRYKDSGYPTQELRQIALTFFWLTGIKIGMWYRKNNGGRGLWVDLLEFKTYVTQHRPSPERPCLGRITIFQCDDTGKIRDDFRRGGSAPSSSRNSTLEDADYMKSADDGGLGRMMHAIGIHPTPSFFTTVDESTRFGKTNVVNCRKRLVEDVNTHSQAFFDEMYRIKKHWDDIDMRDIIELVALQKTRYSDKCVRTLIFSEKTGHKKRKEDEEKREEPVWKQKRWEESGGSPEFYIFAYDLETVNNSKELHREEGRVWEPFRDNRFVSLTPAQEEIYEPGENQIPFSAQWVAVNASDTGVYLERKEKEFGYEGCARINTAVEYEVDRTSENGEFFLSSVQTEDGEGKLGKCVEDMLVNIATYTHARGGKKAICYAHNGAHFDAFIVLQYQRFQITHILKTSRGVMSVSIRVPVVPSPPFGYDYRVDDLDVPKVTVILRDTMLHVPGSLARLCKGFNVPKEYCKMDFPIQKVNGFNYNHPAIAPIIKEYGENDVKALGVIIVRINTLIGSSPWRPANINSLKPPIAQFVTCMGMIRESTRLHFKNNIPGFLHPKAIDVPALRNWLQVATIGGRVNAYAKTYTSIFAGEIMKAAIRKDVPLLQELYLNMIESNQCTQVLDVTSLYPFAMDSCPMPTGALNSILPEDCWTDIDAIHCDECDKLLSLCPIHRCTYDNEHTGKRPFSIIIVKNVGYTKCQYKRNMCPRKSFMKSTQKATCLVYSLENGDEYCQRTNEKEEIRETQAFTNIDLYWMRRQGFSFEVVGGFGFETSMVYNLFIGPAFQNRIRAKQEGNKLLSDFLKLNYNGSFGITTQHDIDETFALTRIDDSLKYRDPRDPEVRTAIYDASRGEKGLESMEELTGEAVYLQSGQIMFQKRKKEHLGEFFSDQSPMQIGAAVLSWSRHVGNLIMFNLHEEDQLYTDTDSFDVNNAVTVNNPFLAAKICNRDDAPLGSLKNDHAENNGTEPRIFFSMIGTKKVKCHMTLNQEGKIRIFNTFKGLNVSTEDEETGTIKHPDYAEYISTKTLLHLNVSSSSPPVTVSSWKRDLQTGVTIGNHLQTLSPNTYLEDCKGTVVRDKEYGTVEFFIPHGCIVNPDYPVYQDVEKGLECTQGERRKKELISRIWKGIDSVELVEAFVDDYYQGVDCEYNPGTAEYKHILEAFESISKNQ